MSEWKTLSTLQEVAAAQAAGEEICIRYTVDWKPWDGFQWNKNYVYRSRPAKKTKTIVLRECLRNNPIDGYYTQWREIVCDNDSCFVCWLDTPERIVEIE